MPRTFTPSPPPPTASPAAPTPSPPAVPNPTPSAATFYTALPLILACQSSPPQWNLIHHTLSNPTTANLITPLPALQLLLQLPTLNHTLSLTTSPLLDSLLSASTSSSTALLHAVHRICHSIQQLATCHTHHSALNTANSELILHFRHQVVLLLTRQHATLRQQLLDDVTHSLLPPASLHPLVRAFYGRLRGGRASMADYVQQYSYQSFQQQWSTYSTLLLHTPTLRTACQQLKQSHSDVLPALLSPAASEVGEVGMDGSVEVELEGEWVSERQLYEWLKQYRTVSDGSSGSMDDVSNEWQRIANGTHETIVAWKVQRERQSDQSVAAVV